MTYIVKCNNVPRLKTYGFELPTDVRKEFDYLSDEEFETREFVQYKGEWYDLGDVLLAPDSIAALGFQGFNSDTFFSGIGFRYFDKEGNYMDDHVVVALIFSGE